MIFQAGIVSRIVIFKKKFSTHYNNCKSSRHTTVNNRTTANVAECWTEIFFDICYLVLMLEIYLFLGLYRSSAPASAKIWPFLQIRLRPKLGRIWNFAGFGKLLLNNTNLNDLYIQNLFPTTYDCSINGMCHFIRVRTDNAARLIFMKLKYNIKLIDDWLMSDSWEPNM